MAKKREQHPETKAPEQLIRDLVQAARLALIPETLMKGESKWFYQQLWHFRKAVTHPAAILAQKGVRLPWDRYQEIVLLVIKDAARFAVGEIRWPGGYLRKCVQLHMAKHWEEYYEEAKAMRLEVDKAVDRIQPTPETQVVEILATVNAALSLNKPKRARKKETGAETQLGLL